jgi:DNA-binding transcriptional regulator YhcF (GntR family)
MNDQELTTGNPDSGSGDDFFERMEQAVNGGIVDDQPQDEVTPSVNSGPTQATRVEQPTDPNSSVDWEKRYKDSSREAQRMAGELKDLKPFVPVLEAMKDDSGLVDHVRGYFENGGAPVKNIKERLGLNEDFMYNEQEAMEDPESDSAKVFEAHVNSMVNNKVDGILKDERTKAVGVQRQIKAKQQEVAFKEKHNMSEEDYANLVEEAKQHTLSLDDIHYLLNKDKTKTNIANSTKADMLKQMKTARDIPTTASGTNSQGSTNTHYDDVFDAILGTDSIVDNLFD